MDGRGDIARRAQLEVAPRRAGRLVEYALATAIFLGSFGLWIAVPLASLWLGSLLSDDGTTVMLAVLIICPISMLAYGLGLSVLYAAYLRAADAHPMRTRSGWLGSATGDRRPAMSARRPVLDFSLTFSAIVAGVLLIVWFLLFAENPNPGLPVP